LGVGISADLANCLSFYFGLNYMRSEKLSISAAGLFMLQGFFHHSGLICLTIMDKKVDKVRWQSAQATRRQGLSCKHAAQKKYLYKTYFITSMF